MLTILYIVAIIIYFVPGCVASSREHPSSVGIWLLNIFVGWTFIGWVLSLVWACSGNPKGIVSVQSSSSFSDELQKLVSLKEQGALTEDEFNKQKHQLLKQT